MAMKTLGVRLDPDLYAKLAELASARGDTISDYARFVLIAEVKEQASK